MAKPQIKHNPKVAPLFEDLEKYKEFCVDYGYKFDEATLYDMRSYVFRQCNKYMTGKPVKNNWDEAIIR